ncbi:MAG: SDR family oxidoreductase [Candidatus Omnitrophica bacterium]|nr:SDR family oxidoreductase [Candidatus Omnitrophota bacterium]MDD5081035.1 SDR family oxidoreductase [Candidatus Omnitrophota bacterium]MDD5441019.1 SDR family oxidoreductase [Candidatus Omnitrophota bacterium]
MKKTIVTGGAGFIGSHLVELLLSKGYEVTVIDSLSTGRLENLTHVLDKIKFVEADISVQGDWINEFLDKDKVFHLAALADIVPSIKNPVNYYNTNVNGTFNVILAAREHKVKRFVYAASSSCYGIPDEYPTKETADIKPEYPYALTKRLGEELVLHWAKVYDFPAVSCRFFNVYGPRSRTSGTYGAVFGVFLAQKIAGKPYTIVGDGEQTRDFTFVTDVAEAMFAAAESDKISEVYNVGSSKTVSVNKIVQLLGGDKVFIPKRPGEPDITFADITKIQKELGWMPKVQIEEGIKIMLDNIDYWKNAPVWEPESIKEQTKDWFSYLGKEK